MDNSNSEAVDQNSKKSVKKVQSTEKQGESYDKMSPLQDEEIEKLNQKLLIMQNMPNNNIGLSHIFRRFREMDVPNQKQYLFGLYIEYIKHFANIFTQFETFKSEHDIVQTKLKQLLSAQDSDTYQKNTNESTSNTSSQKQSNFMSQEEIQCRDQIKTLKTNMINMCLELLNLLRLSKRLSFYCPIDYISEPFFILYASNKDRVLNMKKNLIEMLDEDSSSGIQSNQESIVDVNQPNFESQESNQSQNKQSDVNLALDLTKKVEQGFKFNQELSLDLVEEIHLSDISEYINDDPDIDDKEINLRSIENHPYKLVLNDDLNKFGPQIQENFELLKSSKDEMVRQQIQGQLFQIQQFQYKVIRRLNDKEFEVENQIKDEFYNQMEIDLQQIMRQIFLNDGRIYKHYRLLSWFPSYMQSVYRSQLLIMDNNEFGEEMFMNQFEIDIFPKYVNYYLGIMAVSCYQCEYLLHILQEQFILAGGPLNWLIFGLEKVDAKLKRIVFLNEKLAYKPWSITKDDFQLLIKEGETPSENWQVQEVLKASIIFSTYHGLCGLCHGMGIVIDKDIVSSLLSIVGPKSIMSLISESTFNDNDLENFISVQLGSTIQQNLGDMDRSNSQSDILKSERSDRSSQKGEQDYKSERIYNILRQSQVHEQSDNDQVDESDLMYNPDFNEDADVDADVDADDEDEGYYNDPVEKMSYGAANRLTRSKDRKIEEIQKNFDNFYIDEQQDQTISSSGKSSRELKRISSKEQSQKKEEDSSQIVMEQQEQRSRKDSESLSNLEKSLSLNIPYLYAKHRAMHLNAYQDFIKTSNIWLDIFQFSWDIHGQAAFSKFLPNITKLITDQINLAFVMTRKSYANKKDSCDTTLFRESIIQYLKLIHGIRDETFKKKQAEINKLFDMGQKKYIKDLCCKPQEINFDSYSQFVQMLYDSEKCHVCILALETKKQISLTYLAKALSEYIN